MLIKFVANMDEEQLQDFKGYLYKNEYPFKMAKAKHGRQKFTVDVKEAIDAFWIGCNIISISNDLFKK